VTPWASASWAIVILAATIFVALMIALRMIAQTFAPRSRRTGV
jgi:hypothetical protein